MIPLRFADTLQSRGVNLKYMGESAGVLAYRYLQQLMVRPRMTISEEVTATLMNKQSNRCGACGDILGLFFEKHHKKPVSAGGTDDTGNLLLLCPPCRAQETGKQEQASGDRYNVYLESQLSQIMYRVFWLIYHFRGNCIGVIKRNKRISVTIWSDASTS